ncbi:MAG: hypothetical protein WBD66_06025 [Candidatus Acidiferrales bacterium]
MTSATLVAVTVIEPADNGATKVAEVTVWALNDPADAIHVTPAAPTSFVTVALKLSACPPASPPRFGVILTLTFVGGVVPPPDDDDHRRKPIEIPEQSAMLSSS